MTGRLAYLLRPRALLLRVSVVLPWKGRGLKPCAQSLMLLLFLRTGHKALRMRRDSLPQLRPASAVLQRHLHDIDDDVLKRKRNLQPTPPLGKQVCQLRIALGQAVQTLWGQTF